MSFPLIFFYRRDLLKSKLQTVHLEGYLYIKKNQSQGVRVFDSNLSLKGKSNLISFS